jgi:ABC-2 type transport system ATP-binding protein
LNSHFLSEVEITCDRVAFIKQGIVIQTNSLSSLAGDKITLTIRAANLTDPIMKALSQWGDGIAAKGDQLTMTPHHEETLPAINRFLVENGVEVYAFNPHKLSLEDIFLRVVGDANE